MDEQPSERDLGYAEGALRSAFKSADEIQSLREVVTILEQSLASWQQLARRRAKLLETIRADLSNEAVLKAPRQRAYQLVEIICRELGE